MLRLAAGMADLSSATQQRHARFVKSLQQADGGFGGRQGSSDPYYTSFALRTLVLTNQLDAATAERAGTFLCAHHEHLDSMVDVISTVISVALIEAVRVERPIMPLGWHDRVGARLESLRCEDGGYCKGAAGAAGSVYQTFLTLVCYELMQQPVPAPSAVVDFLRQRELPSGGFLDIRVAKRAGTNPTAAAIGALKILDALDEDVSRRTCEFLARMQNSDGGFLANTRIPVADLLSTFTAYATLDDLGGLDLIDTEAIHRFVSACEQLEGGFVAAAWDAACDIEYTFYGLGCLALKSRR